jgi:acetyl esterase/lipase
MEQQRLRSVLRTVLRVLVRDSWSPRIPLPLARTAYRLFTSVRLPQREVSRSGLRMNGVPAERIVRRGARPDAAILYLHGGGYCLGSPASHRAITMRLAALSGAEVFVPHYRLAPEHVFPAMTEDALACCRWLREAGYAAEKVVFSGDSAGAGLAVLVAQRLRDAGEPLPAGLALISPWVDLSMSGASAQPGAVLDPVQSVPMLKQFAEWCRGPRPPADPLCSPLFGELAGLSPLLVQVGSDEILLSDAERLVERAGAAGVAARLHRFDGLWHVFHVFTGTLTDADAALAELAAFVRDATGTASG